MNKYFECRVRYNAPDEKGITRSVASTFLVDAYTFTEAEIRITDAIAREFGGEFTVLTIKRSNICSVIKSDSAAGDRWFKAKVVFIVPDEKTDKDMRTASHYLVEADSIDKAHDAIVADMRSLSTVDYEIASLDESPIIDVFLLAS